MRPPIIMGGRIRTVKMTNTGRGAGKQCNPLQKKITITLFVCFGFLRQVFIV